MEGELHLAGSVKATKLKLTWLADIPSLVPLTLVDFGPLITKKKPEEDDEIENLFNEHSVSFQTFKKNATSSYPRRPGNLFYIEICEMQFTPSPPLLMCRNTHTKVFRQQASVLFFQGKMWVLS